MKSVTIFCFALLANSAFGQFNDTRKRKNDEALTPTWHTMELPLNYFDALDNRSFTMRYLTNDQFYKKGGPIIVYVGGEWEIADYGVMGGIAFQLARKHSGYLYYPEHRYFGKSLPFPKPVPTENLKYMTPDYSLADLAYSLSMLKSQVEGLENSQVVLVGGSYAGTLATWGRLKYPHIVSAAYACGAVIKIEPENHEYYQIIFDAYQKINPTCLNLLLDGKEEALRMNKNKQGKKILVSMFPNLHCEYKLSRFDLVQNIISIFNPQVWPVDKVAQVCDFLLNNATGSPLKRIQQYNNLTLEDAFCRYDEISREWNYLLCNFIGNIQSTSDNNYGRNHTLYTQQLENTCNTNLGLQYSNAIVEKHVKRTSILYGGSKPDVTKVLSVQGTHDPWRSHSILDDLNEETPVVFIEGAFHCLELGEEQDDETAQVLQSKYEILEQLSRWII